MYTGIWWHNYVHVESVLYKSLWEIRSQFVFRCACSCLSVSSSSSLSLSLSLPLSLPSIACVHSILVCVCVCAHTQTNHTHDVFSDRAHVCLKSNICICQVQRLHCYWVTAVGLLLCSTCTCTFNKRGALFVQTRWKSVGNKNHLFGSFRCWRLLPKW